MKSHVNPRTSEVFTRIRQALVCLGAGALLLSLASAPPSDVVTEQPQPETGGQPAAAAREAPRLAILTLHDDMIDDVTASSLKRRGEAAIQEGAGIIVLELDTPGGMVSSSVDIAKWLRNLSENQGIKTVAWVRDEAISGGTMVAMACDEIVMSRASKIGDCGVIMLGAGGATTAQDPALDAKIESYVLAVFESAARRNGYDPLLCDSFVRHEIEVWWVENTSSEERRFVSTEEKGKLLKMPADTAWGTGTAGQSNMWRLVETYIDPLDGVEKKLRQPIVPDDKLLTIDQSMAMVLGFSKALVRDESELADRYGSTLSSPQLPRYVQSWSERLVSWLTSPTVRMFLIAIIGMGAYVEFQSPGIGLPGLAAVVALAVFLGAPYLTGLANVWEIVVISLGVALILVEVFVIPGFGLAGVAGVTLLLVGLLATFMPEEPGRLPIYWPALPQSFDGLKSGIVTLAGGVAISLLGMFLLGRYFSQIPYVRNIAPPNPTAEAVTVDDPYYGLAHVGDIGRCEGPLRPSGKARFGSRLVDVVTEGDLLDAGMEVEVIERHGNRVVVRRVS